MVYRCIVYGDMATKADLAALEARLTWRLVGAMAAIGAVLRFIG